MFSFYFDVVYMMLDDGRRNDFSAKTRIKNKSVLLFCFNETNEEQTDEEPRTFLSHRLIKAA